MELGVACTTRQKQLLRNTKQLQKKLKCSWISTDKMASLMRKDSMERKVHFWSQHAYRCLHLKLFFVSFYFALSHILVCVMSLDLFGSLVYMSTWLLVCFLWSITQNLISSIFCFYISSPCKNHGSINSLHLWAGTWDAESQKHFSNK